MRNILCALLCLIVFGSGCSTKNTEALEDSTRVLSIPKASEQAVPLSTVVSSLKFIPLETDSVLLSGSLRLDIRNDYILALNLWDEDVRPVLFSTSGRFLGRPGRTGNGPNEFPPGYFQITRVFIDDAAQIVDYVQRGCVYRFAFDGRLIEKRMIGGNLKDQITDTALLKQFAPESVIMYPSGRNIVAKFGPGVFISTDGGAHFLPELGTVCPNMVVYNSEGTRGVFQPGWNVRDDHVSIFDYETGGYKRFYYDGRTSIPFQIDNPGGFAIPKNSPTVVSFVFETPRFLIFDVGNWSPARFTKGDYLYDKKTDELIRLKKPDENKPALFVNDLYPGIDLNLNRGTEDGRLYQVIDAADFREQAFACGDANLRKMAAGMKDDDNQVVVLAEIRE